MIFWSDFDYTLLNSVKFIKKRERGKICEIANAPFSFDIETTSFLDNDGNKRATMYIFMFGLNGYYIYGRTWDDFVNVLDKIKSTLKLTNKRKIIIYIHNLAYEFQFLIGHVVFSDVFARDCRHPIRATANGCFDLKCSYFLSGAALETVAKDLTIVKISKQTGKLDYTKIRHYDTPLTAEEMKYCEYDVKILHYFILEEMEKNGGDITKIPLTKTGYVRNYCRNYIKKNTYYVGYRKKLIASAPLDPNLFALMHKCFSGGYTHANCLYVGDVMDNVSSIDFTSSYPAQMIRHKYPSGQFIKYQINSRDDLLHMVNKYACLMELEILDIRPKSTNHILSRSKCLVCDNAVIDNGRVAESDRVITYFTDIDFNDFCKFYDFSKIAVIRFYFTTYKLLPKPLIECVLKFYEDKTKLKDVGGMEQEYLISKGMVNGVYGMCVTNPVNNDVSFNGREWQEIPKDIEQALYDNYVKNKKQFLLYQWGVWITAWARHELYNGMLHIGDDVVYCDTDSIKFINGNKYKTWIDEYNKNCICEIAKNLKSLEINPERASPKTRAGKQKPLGVWTVEPTYDKFKTLGAKRYCYICKGKFNITVSGLNKNSAVPYMLDYAQQNNIDVFDMFDDDMHIPPEHTGKMTHTYIDEPYKLRLTDYLGNVATVAENAYIHLTAQDYNLSLSAEFISFLTNDNYTELSKNHKLYSKPKILAINASEYDWSVE